MGFLRPAVDFASPHSTNWARGEDEDDDASLRKEKER
jgi:hypothetical protein